MSCRFSADSHPLPLFSASALCSFVPHSAGHRQLECPQRNQSWQPANIRCNICGSDLHPSQDCPQRFQRTAEQAAREMDSEYSSFMNEIVGDGPVSTRTNLRLTDGGAGGGGPAGPPPQRDGPPSGAGGYGPGPGAPSHGGGGGPPMDRGPSFHPDRGGSRVVKDPREGTFREFRPAHVPSLASSLPAISARDGFAHAGPVSGPPPPPQGGHGAPYGQPHHGGGYGGPPPPPPHYGGPPPHHGGGGYHNVPPPQWGPGGPGGYRGGPPPPPHYGGGPPMRGPPPPSWSNGPRGPPPAGWQPPPPPPPPGAY